MFKVPDQYRYKGGGPYSSTSEDGNNGAFYVPMWHKLVALCIATDQAGWEHVSITMHNNKKNLTRCPTWNEMCRIKDMFWDEEDVVIQYHPAKKDYISQHPYCLHLWRKIGFDIPTPPPNLIGLKHKK